MIEDKRMKSLTICWACTPANAALTQSQETMLVQVHGCSCTGQHFRETGHIKYSLDKDKRLI